MDDSSASTTSAEGGSAAFMFTIMKRLERATKTWAKGLPPMQG